MLGIFDIISISSYNNLGYYNLAVSKSGNVYYFGLFLLNFNNLTNVPKQIQLKNVKKAISGSLNAFFYITDEFNSSSIYAIENNINGQLGVGNYQDKSIPTLVLWSLYNNIDFIYTNSLSTYFISNGQLFISGMRFKNGTLPFILYSLPIKTNITLAGFYSIRYSRMSYLFYNKTKTYFIEEDPKMRFFSQFTYLNPQQTFQEYNIEHIYNNYYSLFLKTKTKDIFVQGANYFGQLGLNFTSYDAPLTKLQNPWGKVTIIKISCGLHTLFLTNNYTLYSCGNNQVFLFF